MFCGQKFVQNVNSVTEAPIVDEYTVIKLTVRSPMSRNGSTRSSSERRHTIDRRLHGDRAPVDGVAADRRRTLQRRSLEAIAAERRARNDRRKRENPLFASGRDRRRVAERRTPEVLEATFREWARLRAARRTWADRWADRAMPDVHEAPYNEWAALRNQQPSSTGAADAADEESAVLNKIIIRD
jgi:hypothetical protein